MSRVEKKLGNRAIRKAHQAIKGQGVDRLVQIRQNLCYLQMTHPEKAGEVGRLIREVNDRIRALHIKENELFYRYYVEAGKELLPEDVHKELSRSAKRRAREYIGLKDAMAPKKLPMAFDPDKLYEEYGKQRVLDAYSVCCQQGTRPQSESEMREILGPR